MGDAAGFIDAFLGAVIESIEPLADALTDGDAFVQLMDDLGWGPPDGDFNISDVAAFIDVVPALQQAQGLLDTVRQGSGQDPALLTELSNAVASMIAGLTGLASGQAPSTLPAPLNSSGFWVSFAEEIVGHLLDSYLRRNKPLTWALMYLTGILDDQPVAASDSRIDGYAARILRWDRIGQFLQHPQQVVGDVYGWGSSFRYVELTRRLFWALSAAGLRPLLEPPDQAIVDQQYGTGASAPADVSLIRLPIFEDSALDAVTFEAGLVFVAVPSAHGAAGTPQALMIAPYAAGEVTALFSLAPDVTLVIDGTVDAEGGVAIRIAPGQVSVDTPGVALSDSIGVEVDYAPAASWTLLGGRTGTGVTLAGASIGLRLSGIGTVPVLELRAGFQGLVASLSLDGADGFLAEFIGGGALAAKAGGTLVWSSQAGLHFEGGSLTISLPQHINLGVILLTGAHATVGVDGGTPSLTLAVDASGQLGPIVCSVQGIGAKLSLDSSGSGPVAGAQLGIGFKPPDGVGLALTAPPVSGSGFLAYLPADSRYLGAMALAVGDVSIAAVGVLDTKPPGYSLIILASAQFPPVELGFGFSLTGIGGLVAVNRTADVPSLQALARAGRLDDLMFPADLIHRAPQVAANLARQFPAAPGHFIVGPAVQIQWGTGRMINADIGVFIELSDSGGVITTLRIALLGLVHLTLPAGATPVADITLDILGVLDFAAQTVSLDAGLRKSTIAAFPLTGQAALRASWGSNPTFLLAIGGFNPHFQAPAGFPALQRVTLAIGSDNPRLTLSAYLALTSNTLQLGCAAQLYAAQNVFGVTAAVSASLAFDALLQFKPFGLIVDLTIAAAILVNNNPILMLKLDLHVTGPAPWTVSGSATFQFTVFTITIPVSITAGSSAPPQSPQLVDLNGNLLAALADPHSWATAPPPGHGLVRVRGQNAANPALHPLGSLAVRQHAVPLGQRIDRYGPDLLDAACQYDITGASLGGQPASGTAVADFFAPAQYLTMNDADKLSAPSFEMMTAGLAFGDTGLILPASGQAVVDTVSTATWDAVTLDSPDPTQTGTPTVSPPTTGSLSVPDTLLAAQLAGAAAAVNGPAARSQVVYASRGIGVAVQPPAYAVVAMNLTVATSAAAPAPILWIATQTAGQTAATQGGYSQPCQVVYTSEVPG